MTKMDFSEALKRMKLGSKFRREHTPTKFWFAVSKGELLLCTSHHAESWYPTRTEVMAEDWIELSE